MQKEAVDCYNARLTIIYHLHAIVTHCSDPRLMTTNFSLQNENIHSEIMHHEILTKVTK